jgi:hypothetical protein
MEIGLLVLWLVLCCAAGAYAGKKGRSAVGFFLLSLFLSPLVAFILIAVGPSDPHRMGLRKCPQCAEWVKAEAIKCRFCSFDFHGELSTSVTIDQPKASAPAIVHGREAGDGGLIWLVGGGVIAVLGLSLVWFTNWSNHENVEASETAAISSLRMISTSCFTYDSKFSHGYPEKLSTLGPPPAGGMAGAADADLLDLALSSGAKDGYVFEYSPGRSVHGRVKSYAVIARPVGQSQGRRFFLDESGVIRQSIGIDPDKYSSPL